MSLPKADDNAKSGYTRVCADLLRKLGRVAAVFAILASTSSSVAQEPPGSAEQLRQELRARIPAAGFVEVMLEREQPPEAQCIGYDIGSRTFYQYRVGTGWGYNGGDGPFFIYANDEWKRRLATMTSDLFIERYALPTAWIHRALQRPGSIQDISRAPDGSFRLRVHALGGDPGAESDARLTEPWSYDAVVSADGRDVSIERTTNRDGVETVLVGHVGPGIPVYALAPGGWRVVFSRFTAAPSSRPVTAALARDMIERTRERESLLKLEDRRAHSTLPSPSDPPPAIAPFQPTLLARWGRPLVLAGVILCGVAAWLYWKFRR